MSKEKIEAALALDDLAYKSALEKEFLKLKPRPFAGFGTIAVTVLFVWGLSYIFTKDEDFSLIWQVVLPLVALVLGKMQFENDRVHKRIDVLYKLPDKDNVI